MLLTHRKRVGRRSQLEEELRIGCALAVLQYVCSGLHIKGCSTLAFHLWLKHVVSIIEISMVVLLGDCMDDGACSKPHMNTAVYRQYYMETTIVL